MLTLCQHTNAPIKAEKVVPPSTQITFLGIVIDTNAMTASISNERKSLMLEELQSFVQHKMHKTGATLPHRQAIICVQSSSCRPHLPMSSHRLEYDSEISSPSHTARLPAKLVRILPDPDSLIPIGHPAQK